MKVTEITTGSRYGKLDEDITFTIKVNAPLSDKDKQFAWSVHVNADSH